MSDPRAALESSPSGAAPLPPTVAAALSAAEQAGLDRLDLQRLLAHVLNCSRTWLITHRDSRIGEAQWQTWIDLQKRLADGEPLAYLLQQQGFFGLTLEVGPAVLIPRSDTETLVEWAAEILRQRAHTAAPPAVVDLGCGSGAIALALKSTHPAANLTGVDVSSEALAVAASNGARLQLAIDWQNGDWWNAVGDTRFDLVVSNPPYIAADDPHLAALRHEPMRALVADDDGLAALRAIVAGAPRHLEPQAWLLLEHGIKQAAAVSGLLLDRGFEGVQTRCDLAGRPRCTGGRWPGPVH